MCFRFDRHARARPQECTAPFKDLVSESVTDRRLTELLLLHRDKESEESFPEGARARARPHTPVI